TSRGYCPSDAVNGSLSPKFPAKRRIIRFGYFHPFPARPAKLLPFVCNELVTNAIPFHQRKYRKKGDAERAGIALVRDCSSYATCARTCLRCRPRIAKPIAPKPSSIIAQVEASGSGKLKLTVPE